MKIIILMISYFLIPLYLNAQTISGKISGLQEGEKILLYTNSEKGIENQWGLSKLTDSTTIKDDKFTLRIPETANGKLWLLRTPDKLLRFFFNKNESIFLYGEYIERSLKNEKIEGGRDYTLFEDIHHILDESILTPITRRAGVEWLKRHAAEDICPFATAYFYIVRQVLRFKDVKEIMDCIPSSQRENPYFIQLAQHYSQDSIIQPGNSLPELTLFTRDGKKITGESLQGRPLLIHYFTQKNNGNTWLKKLRELKNIQNESPDLQLVLVHPEFSAEIMSKMADIIPPNTVITTDYAKTFSTNPVLFGNRYKTQNIILADKNGCILALNPDRKECAELITGKLTVDGFRINGYVSGLVEGIAELIVIKEGTLSTPQIIDTAIIQNGYFNFKGKSSNTQFCNIAIRNTFYPIALFLENSSIDINIHLGLGAKVQNGVSNSVITLNGKIYGCQALDNYQYLQLLKDVDAITSWIEKHPSDMLTLFCLTNLWSSKYPPDQVEKWIKQIDNSLSDHIAYRTVKEQIDKRRIVAIGQKAPDFTLPSKDGKMISLKDFTGKYTLIDFWASWCGPCRAEIPTLKKIRKKYSPKELELISITIDKSEQNWREAMQQEQMPWTQLNANDTNVSDLYNVQTIPHIMLIGPDSKIVGINLRGKALENKLAEILK